METEIKYYDNFDEVYIFVADQKKNTKKKEKEHLKQCKK